MEKENEQLKRKLLLQEGEINLLEKQKSDLIINLNNALRELNQRRNHTCSTGSHLQRKSTEKRALVQAQQDLEEKESKINELTSQLAGTLRSLYDLQEENKELVKRPSLVVHQELKNSFTKAQATLTTEQKKATEAGKKAQQTELINTELTEKLKTETEAKEHAENNLTLANKKISDLQANNSEVELWEKLVADLHRQHDLLLDNYSQEKITHDLTKTQLNDTKQNLQDFQTKNQQFQTDIERIIAERDARPDISQSEYNDLVQKVQKLGKEQKKVSPLQKKAQNVRKELANKKTAHFQTQSQLTNEQNKTANLQSSLLSEQLSHGITKNERDNLLSQLTNANTTLATYEDYLKNELKITDLTDLPILPTKQSLTDLINFFNIRSQHNCFNSLHNDYDSLKFQLNQAKSERDQLATENEELKNQKAQIENDYHKEKQARQKVEQERDNYRQQLSQQEKEIIIKFITGLKLVNCNKNSSPEKVIATIQQLLTKPDTDNFVTPFGENLASIKRIDLKMFQNLSIILPKELENQIEHVNNYQGLVDLRQQLIQTRLVHESNQFQTVSQAKNRLINQQKNERIIFIVLLAIGALAIVSLVAKLRNIRNTNKTKNVN